MANQTLILSLQCHLDSGKLRKGQQPSSVQCLLADGDGHSSLNCLHHIIINAWFTPILLCYSAIKSPVKATAFLLGEGWEETGMGAGSGVGSQTQEPGLAVALHEVQTAAFTEITFLWRR